AEHLHGVEIRLRRDARAYQEALRVSRRIIGTGISLAVQGDSEPRKSPRRMGTVTVAVERIRVGLRDGGRIGGVVGVTGEIDATFDLGRVGSDETRVRGLRIARERRLVG